jgi:SAM-dependent methyltransferase
VPVVYGVDRSPEMLRVAIAKNRCTGARFLLQDFARLQLPQPVDLITCHFDSLNYLLTTADLLRALIRFRINLRPGGHVIFDMLTDRLPRQGLRPGLEEFTRKGVTVMRMTHWDPRRCLQTAVVSILQDACSQRCEVHQQRRYPVAVVTGLLTQAGFAHLDIYDSETFKSATNWTSRAIYIARVQERPGQPLILT